MQFPEIYKVSFLKKLQNPLRHRIAPDAVAELAEQPDALSLMNLASSRPWISAVRRPASPSQIATCHSRHVASTICSTSAHCLDDFYAVALAQDVLRVQASWHNLAIDLDRHLALGVARDFEQCDNAGAVSQFVRFAVQQYLHCPLVYLPPLFTAAGKTPG
jgi:hypothetical protein